MTIDLNKLMVELTAYFKKVDLSLFEMNSIMSYFIRCITIHGVAFDFALLEDMEEKFFMKDVIEKIRNPYKKEEVRQMFSNMVVIDTEVYPFDTVQFTKLMEVYTTCIAAIIKVEDEEVYLLSH